MKHLNENPDFRNLNETETLPGSASIKRLPSAADGTMPEAAESNSSDSPARPVALKIEYSTTRNLPASLESLRQTNGVVTMDRSPLSEAYKRLRNQVLLRMQAEGHNVLAITSPHNSDAKSLAAANLALAMAAEYDSAVLLVDADLADRKLQKMFGLDREPGLSEYLLENAQIPDLLISPGVKRLVFLPAGRPVLNSAELLATKATQYLINEIKQRYTDRYIIVDLPPMLDTADALAFMPRADAVLLVVEENKTSMQDIEQAAELLAPFNLIGTVFDKGQEEEPGEARPWYRRVFA